MRILIAHNFYRSSSPSGENQAVEALAEWLAAEGAAVEVAGWRSDDLAQLGAAGKAAVAGRMIRCRDGGAVAERAARFGADVVQLHNPVPHIAPDDVALLQQRTPVVQVIHNYRHTCLNGSHRRAGADCFSCGGTRWHRGGGVRHACYRGSTAQSALLALSEAAHHDTWRSLDGYVAISGFVRDYLVRSGFPDHRIATIPHPVARRPIATTGRDVLFAGRLTEDKGVVPLLAAWAALPDGARSGRTLHVAGAGPAEDLVAAAAAARADVVFHGPLDRAALGVLEGRCGTSVVPSLWDEPFGLVAVEALAAGRGVVATARGALPEIASDPACSWLAEPDGPDLTAALSAALSAALTADPGAVAVAARRHWAEHYSPEVVARAHLGHLRSVVDARRAAPVAASGPGGHRGRAR